MRIRTVQHPTPFPGLRNFITYTLSQCKADPLAASYAIKVDELRLGWDSAYAKHLALLDKSSEAQARVNNASHALSRMAGRVAKAILAITDDNRHDPLYMAYIGNKTLSELKKRFSSKLEAMRGWIPNMKVSEHPSLAAFADEVEQLVDTADAAVKMRSDVSVEKRYFRDTGDRKKLVDKINVVCKSIHGDLSKFPHEIPGLPHDYADRFFLSEVRQKDKDEDEDTEEADPIDAAKARIKAAKEELEAAEAHMKEVEAEQAAAAEAAAALAAQEAKLADLEAELSEKAKLAAEMKAEIEKAKTG
jgi:hypothetical protein